MMDAAAIRSRMVRLHLKLGWIWIVAFASLGLALEGLHGLKVGLYLDVGMETRRLMWTLAHSHGTLLGLLHIVFALTLERVFPSPRALGVASRALVGAGVLLPMGFFLGGVVIHGGDPGLGVFLVPVGALCLIGAAAIVVVGLRPSEDA